MKIAIIGPVYPFRGGISHSNTILCSNLSKRHDVLALSFKRLFPKILFPGREQKYSGDSEKKELPFKALYILDSLNPINWIKTAFEIRKFNPELVIFQWWAVFLAPMTFFLSLLVKLMSKAKVCIYCQNVLQHEPKFFDKPMTKMAFLPADYLIVLAESDGKILSTLKPKARYRLLVEPTYESTFGKKMPKEEAKKKLGIKGNAALFFGFVRPYKGLKYLIEAMPEAVKKVPFTLLIVGEFWGGKEQYVKRIEELGMGGRVIIIDRYVADEEVPLYFSAADVCVLPYTSATQSGILQVAFGYDVPTITTNVGGLPDFVKNEKTGILVKPKDAKGLSEAICSYFWESKEGRFAENIKKEKKRFEWGRDKERSLFFGLK